MTDSAEVQTEESIMAIRDRSPPGDVDLRALGERMKKAREALKMVQSDLAAKVGVSRAAISQWEAGDVEATLTKLTKAAVHLQANLTWLLTGKGNPPADAATNRHWPAAPGVIAQMKSEIGAGATDAHETEVDWWRLPPTVLKAMGSRPSRLKILRVSTPTMAPTINRGSYVLVDFAQRLPHDGQVFAIDNEIAIVLARVYVRPSHKRRKLVELVSDSEPTRRVQVALSEIKIVGRVIAELTRAV